MGKVFRQVLDGQRGGRARFWRAGALLGYVDADAAGYTDLPAEAGLYDPGALPQGGHSVEVSARVVLEEELVRVDTEMSWWSERRTELADRLPLAQEVGPVEALATLVARILAAPTTDDLVAIQAELRAAETAAAAEVTETVMPS